MAGEGALYPLLQRWAQLDPAAPAIGHRQGAWLSRGDLDAHLAAGRRRLRQLGLQPRDRVAVLMPQGLEGAIVALQVASACSLAPLRPGLPPQEWPILLAHLAPAALVIDDEIAPEVVALAGRLAIPLIDPVDLVSAVERPEGGSPFPKVDDHSEVASAVLLATSGSTGRPKWVHLSQEDLLQGCRAMARSLDLTPVDRALLALPLHHAHGLVSGLLMPLISGGSVVVAERFDAAELLQALQELAISWISLPPAMHRALLDQQRRTPLEHGHRLRFLRSGAISLPPHLIASLQAAFGVPLVEAYGMSECPHICGNPIQAPRAGSVGRPVVEQIAILGSDGSARPAGEWGEVAVRGAPLMKGYLLDGLLQPLPAEDGWFRTGDQGRLDAEGYLHLRGRLGETINRGGRKVWPALVDAALLSHPDVEEAVAFALPHPTLGADLAAALVLRAGAIPDEQDLRRHASSILEPGDVPSRILVLEDLPRGPTGKVQRLMMATLLQGSLQSPAEPVSGELETLIAATVAEVLRQPPPGRHANFFQLGGDSLSGTRVIVRLAEALGLDLEPTLLFLEPTVRGLAEHLKQRLQPAMIPALRGDAFPLGAAEPLPGDWPPGCAAFPASDAQIRLWFLHQLEPGLTAYHLPILWRLRGALDLGALEQALAALIERHPTLRTSFQLQVQEVVQLLHPRPSLTLCPEEWQGRDPDQLMAQWSEQEQQTPFDLGSGLLLRARLLKEADDEHWLLLNLHHIASDGWSLAILRRDLGELYNAARSSRPSNLRPLQVHYHDHAVWQRQRLTGERLQELNSYWNSELMGLEPLELPADHPRPATPSYRGGSVCFEIGPALLRPFEDLCRTEGVTLQMGLLAVVALLLHRTSRQDDFAIGVPIWGRNHPDLEELIGFFINLLPIRTRFSPGLSFRELLAQILATSLAAYEQQDLPFEQMVEVLSLERDSSRNPIVQVVLQLIELPLVPPTELDGLEVEMLPLCPDTARFDLEFFLRRTPCGGIRSTLVYTTDLFSADRIQRLTSHLITLLASSQQAPDASIVSLSILPEANRQLLHSWQHGPGIDRFDRCVHQIFAQEAERNPDVIALIVGEQHWNYGELNARADQLADQLIDLGLDPEAIVAVCLERSVELVVTLLAILKAGGAYLPLDPAWPQLRRDQLLREAGCAVLVDAAGLVRWADQPSLKAGAEGLSPGHRLAYISYTSGSTGLPKGVEIEHRSILRLVDPINGFRLGDGAVVLQLAPVAFDAATLEIWGPLLNGGTLVMAPPGPLTPAEVAALLRERQITTLWLTAGLFHAMVESELAALAGVRQVLAGGDVLSPTHVNRLLAAFPPGHELINGYGPTENTTFTCCHRLEAGATVSTAGVPIGRPIAATLVRVLDKSGQPCPTGIPGELHIGGVGLARGYLHNPQLTTETFIPDPFSDDPSARLYKSGDLASWNPDGTLAFHGRIDQQIKLRGFRIEPGEIEAHLLAHPVVGQAAVVLRHDDPANPRLIAYWVASDGSGSTTNLPTTEELRYFLSQRLPDTMVPAAFVELADLPLTSNGKLDRRALPAPCFVGDREQRVEPSTHLERQLHGLWAEVLGHDDFGVGDNFFLVGGHSLAAARLMAAMKQHFGLALPIATIFHAPEIGLMARLLQRSNPGTAVGDPCLLPLQPQGEAAPLFVIHGYGGDVFCYTDFAHALAPDRPVYGLQARGLDGNSERHQSVEEMAEHYAGLIERQWPQGEVHLLGQSAGGWVVWAVASVLLRQGRSIGLVAILDSGPTAAISPRLRASLLLRRTIRRVPAYGHQLSHIKRPRNFLAFLRERRQKLASHLSWFQPEALRQPSAAPPPRAGEDSGLDYFDLLHRRYRPGCLPLRVHLFHSRHDPRMKHRLWRALACGGVEVRPLFEEHHHFHDPSLAGELAAAIAQALETIDGAGTPWR